MNEESYRRVLSHAMAYCSARECCKDDILKKFKDENAGIVEKVVCALIDEGYIDEDRYTRAFIHDKSEFRKWGPEKIRYELRSKNIPGSSISNALDDVPEERWIEILRPMIEKKRMATKADSSYILRGKLIRFAISKGFTISQFEALDFNKAEKK